MSTSAQKCKSKSKSESVPIQVGLPGKVGEGVNAHYEYLITSQTLSEHEVVVHRRYSDFVWLHDQLSKNCAGYIIPPLPEKLPAVLQGEDFLEKRRSGLYRFLCRVYEHKVLRGSKFLDDFLQADAIQFSAVKAKSSAAPSTVTQRKENLSRWWGKTYQKLSENEKVKQLAAKAGKDLSSNSSHCKSEEDNEFHTLLEYMKNLHEKLKAVEAKLTGTQKQCKSASMSFIHVKEAMTAFFESERTRPEMKDVCEWDRIIDPIFELREYQLQAELNEMIEGVTDVTRYVAAALAAMQVREDRRFAYQALLASASKEKEVVVYDASGSSAQDAKDSAMSDPKVVQARQELTTVHDVVMAEVKEFQVEKQTIIQQAFVQFTRFQMKLNEEMNKALQQTLDSLHKELQVSSNSKVEVHPIIIDVGKDDCMLSADKENLTGLSTKSVNSSKELFPTDSSKGYSDVAL